MSAPLVVNTRDGACWTRRTVTSGGIALYALADVCQCPEFVMATLAELAEQGIVGSADVLPMPVGSEPVSEAALDVAVDGLAQYLRVRLALASAQRGRRELRAQATELEAARDQLVRWHGEDAKTITTLVARVDRYRARAAELKADLAAKVQDAEAAVKGWGRSRERVAELEALTAQATEFRLWEPGYGLYVRRAPGATGYGVMEARRTHAGRRVWTTAGWQYSAALSDTELFCWPDAQTAVAEARRIMPGTTVREDADDAPHEGPQHHTYRLGRDLPEAGEPS